VSPLPTIGGTRDAAGISSDDGVARAAALARVLPPGLAAMFDARFVHSNDLYDEFVHRLALRVFREAGVEAVAREPGTVADLVVRAGWDPERALIPLDWIVRHLAERGVLTDAGTAGGQRRVRVRAGVPDLDPAPVREAQARFDSSWLPAYVLAETVARDYPAFLRGEASGEAILFSPARFRLWLDYFSNDNGLYAVNNRLGAFAVDAWWPADGGAILELGGGLGSAALALLERLQGTGRLDTLGEYRFTEVVPAFLRRGRAALEARFPGWPGLRFASLDMNRPFAEQGVEPGSMAVVYAVNTLHVAFDLDFTLGEVFRALTPGGRLILSECVRPLPGQAVYVEFVFNLMETFRAPRLRAPYRPNGGFLTPEQWTGALEASGFTDIRLLPDIVALRVPFSTFCTAAIGGTRPR
jgi:SAM-dependent methyltransferase